MAEYTRQDVTIGPRHSITLGGAGDVSLAIENRSDVSLRVRFDVEALPVPDPSSVRDKMARLFHETYERMAPDFDYETRQASAVPWDDVPENNKRLMLAVCGALVEGGFGVCNHEPFVVDGAWHEWCDMTGDIESEWESEKCPGLHRRLFVEREDTDG